MALASWFYLSEDVGMVTFITILDGGVQAWTRSASMAAIVA
ncbi:MAG TPA: hypothetical protein VGY54_09390 [Polyangiaceae bacterium]|nr:hypothetical protein [Polyangiaceae bacterium]